MVQGDTLYSISRKYSIPVNDLAVINDLNSPFTLSVGQKIKVPDLLTVPVKIASSDKIENKVEKVENKSQIKKQNDIKKEEKTQKEQEDLGFTSKNHLKNFINYLCNSTQKYYNEYTKYNRIYRVFNDDIIDRLNEHFEKNQKMSQIVFWGGAEDVNECKDIADEIFFEIENTMKDITTVKKDYIHFESNEQLSVSEWLEEIDKDIEELAKSNIENFNVCYLAIHLNQPHGPHLHRLYF